MSFKFKNFDEAVAQLEKRLLPLIVDLDFERRTIDPKPNEWGKNEAALRMVIDLCKNREITSTTAIKCSYCSKDFPTLEAAQEHLFTCEAVAKLPAGQVSSSILSCIEELRSPEGSGNAVTILCVNDEPPPKQAVECCGDWTGFKELRFEGASLMQALAAATTAKISHGGER